MADRPRPTLAHVAKRANVSITTASAALRNTGRVNEDTRRLVLEAAAAIGYRKNSGAVALRSGHGGVIGVVLETEALADNPVNPKLFWPRMLNGLAERLTTAGMGLALVARAHPAPLATMPIDALVVLCDPAQTLPFEIPFGMPVISGVRGDSDVTAWAGHDYADIGQACAEHLIDQGAQRVALIEPADAIPTNAILLSALRDALAGRLPVRIISADDESISAALADGADALVTLGENLNGIFAAAAARGLTVPDDVLVLSLSEGDREREWRPAVSTVSFGGRRSGQLVGDLIVAGLRGGAFESITLPYAFDQRASTLRR